MSRHRREDRIDSWELWFWTMVVLVVFYPLHLWKRLRKKVPRP